MLCTQHLFLGFRLWWGKNDFCPAALEDVYEDIGSVTQRNIPDRQ